MTRATQNKELLERCFANVRGDAWTLARKPQRLRIGVREAPDHIRMITLLVKNGKRYFTAS